MKLEGTDGTIQDAEENFRIRCFLRIVDSAKIVFKRNFEMYETHGEVFDLLLNLNKLNVLDVTDILKSKKDVQIQLEGGLEGTDLRSEYAKK